MVVMAVAIVVTVGGVGISVIVGVRIGNGCDCWHG